MQYIIFAVAIIIILFIFYKVRTYDSRNIPGIPKPKYDKKLHVFSAKAVDEGRKAYEQTINQNKEHKNKEAVEEYASLSEELLKFTVMYQSSSDLDDANQVKKQALYWGAWCQEYMKRTDDIANKYNLE